jgi:hypothetical protein
LDQILGCGQRNGMNYFLVRFKNATESELIDWEAAKQYSVAVMEYFGSRLVWKPIQNVIDPDMDEAGAGTDEQNQPTESDGALKEIPSTSKAPNDIEYDH